MFFSPQQTKEPSVFTFFLFPSTLLQYLFAQPKQNSHSLTERSYLSFLFATLWLQTYPTHASSQPTNQPTNPPQHPTRAFTRANSPNHKHKTLGIPSHARRFEEKKKTERKTKERNHLIRTSHHITHPTQQEKTRQDKMKATLVLPTLLALFSARTLAATPPGCLLSAVNTQDNPTDLSSICGDDATDVQSAINSLCSGSNKSAAQSAFIATCSSAGSSVGTSLSFAQVFVNSHNWTTGQTSLFP